MNILKSRANKQILITILSLLIVFSVYAEVPGFDSDKPSTNFSVSYSQVFNTWNGTVFYNQWDMMDIASFPFNASDIASGYLQFVWPGKRILRSKTTYKTPYVFSAVLDWSAGSGRGGMIVRAKSSGNIEALQDPNSDPGFNREGIAFYPTNDGQNMVVQFSGVDNGAGSTTITKINVPKPAGVTTLFSDKGTIRIEDFGTSLYVYFRGLRYFRIDLGGLTGGVYTSGTVYNSDMTSVGTFTGMEVEVEGKVGIAQRDAAMRLYSAEIQMPVAQSAPDAPANVVATAGDSYASVEFTAPVNTGGAPVLDYTVTSSPGGITATGSSSPIIVAGLTIGTSYTFTVTARNSAGNSVASAPSNAVIPFGNGAFDNDKPTATFDSFYSQHFNLTAGWDDMKFYRQWNATMPRIFTAKDIAKGALEFYWIEKRIICSKLPYTPPYLFESIVDYAAGSNRGGVVIRIEANSDKIQEPHHGDPGFNSEGIAFYPSPDGSKMIMQFTGPYKFNATPVTQIMIPKPLGVNSFLQKGTLRIEDFDTKIYVYYNGMPFVRIELSGEENGIYTSGTVYDKNMTILGQFSAMEIEKTGYISVAQRDANLRLHEVNVKSIYKDNVFNPADTVIFESPYRDLYSDTWVATDGLGRKMPLHDDLLEEKSDKRRIAGIFYITWHSEDRYSMYPKPYSADVTKILSTDPSARLDGDHPIWGSAPQGYHWAEPEMGYFLSQDEWVIRKDMALLTNAGVDMIILDVTNAVQYWDEWETLLSTMVKMKAEGNKVPQFCFWAFNGPVITVVQNLYNYFYKQERYKDLWFYWDGKPLLLYNTTPAKDATGNIWTNVNPNYDPDAVTNPNHPNYGNPDYTTEFLTDYTQEVKDFFSTRSMWWGYYQWNGKRYIGTEGNWSFGYDLSDSRVKDMNPADLVSPLNGIKEQAAVTPAQHPTSFVGKSWSRATGQPDLDDYDLPKPTYVPWLGKTVENPEGYGIYFQERWDEALASDPDFLYLNDWNEWTAGKYKDEKVGTFLRRSSNFFFVDQYNSEFNRAIHPMKGGYSDNYYMQMVQNLRKYKGVRQVLPQTASANIVIDNNYTDWQSITTEFRDAIGDTRHRSHNGYGGLKYTNTTGRNDIMSSKVGFDDTNIYFYVKTVRDITPHTDPNWMLLFIDLDRNTGTGWEGYDVVVNLGVSSVTQTSLKRWNGQQWGDAVSCHLAYQGTEMEIAISRAALGITSGIPQFHFKWADNPQHLNDVSAFFTDGEAAPDRRFKYNFSSSALNTEPQAPFITMNIPGTVQFEDFDKGGAGVAYSDASFGNSGGAYRPEESVDIEEKAGGGYNIGWLNANEWLVYTVNVNSDGVLSTYSAKIHYASNNIGNEAIIYVDGEDKTGVINFPNSGGTSNWTTKEVDITLSSGQKVIRFFIKNATEDFKLNKIEFTEKYTAYAGNGTGLLKTIWSATVGGRTWFKDSICSEIDPMIQHNWVDVSPGCDVSNDFWNIRWLGQLQPLFSEDYTFYLTVNDMGRVWIDNQLVIDGWIGTVSGTTLTGTIALTAGKKVPIRVDFAERTGDASIKLEWSSASNPREVVPQKQLYPDISTGISDIMQAHFRVYPNPVKDKLMINTGLHQADEITIYDLQGNAVFAHREQFTGQKTIDIPLPKGAYFIQLKGNVPYAIQKLIVL
ncbi:MAG: PA14 domain-containing protein [Paludibacter sp.]|nr:PA14 domain-containing protein [Paludibacter sp.]